MLNNPCKMMTRLLSLQYTSTRHVCVVHGLLLIVLPFIGLPCCYSWNFVIPPQSHRLPRISIPVQATATTRKHVMDEWEDRNGGISNNIIQIANERNKNRRTVIARITSILLSTTMITTSPLQGLAIDDTEISASLSSPPVQVSVSGEVKKLFNEGRALETQGNIAAAQRLYDKVTKIAPRFIYGWSNLGNTQTVFGDLEKAEESYNIAIDLCNERNAAQSDASTGLGVPRCNDLYILLLNRGCLRLNNGMKKEALDDLRQSEVLRGRPDAIILQNLARAYEMNGIYNQADYDYTTAISMTANEVNPFWIRSSIVKFQLGDVKGGYDLLKRVIVRFPDAPEVRATYAVFLYETGDMTGAQQKFLEIPDRQRLKYKDENYVKNVISWPPSMIERLNKIIVAVGDDKRTV